MLAIVDQKVFNFGFRGPEITLSWRIGSRFELQKYVPIRRFIRASGRLSPANKADFRVTVRTYYRRWLTMQLHSPH